MHGFIYARQGRLVLALALSGAIIGQIICRVIDSLRGRHVLFLRGCSGGWGVPGHCSANPFGRGLERRVLSRSLLVGVGELQAPNVVLVEPIPLQCVNDERRLEVVLEVGEAEDHFLVGVDLARDQPHRLEPLKWPKDVCKAGKNKRETNDTIALIIITPEIE